MTTADDDYAGLPGAFRFAFTHSPSYALRLYVLASALVGGFVAVILALALLLWLVEPAGLVGERALLGVIAILLLGPLFAPVLLVARRHRRTGSDARYDRALAAAGFAFVLSVYAGLVATVPPEWQSDPTGPLAPAADFLYGLPPTWGLLPPVAGALLIALAHLLAR